MTMQIIRLRTHWDAGQAHTVIDFLDELRDQLWATYGDDIIEMLQEDTSYKASTDSTDESELNDEIDF